MERNLRIIQQRIDKLEINITQDEGRFQDAVASFKNFIALSDFPRNLKNSFLNITGVQTRQEYIDSLRKVLNNWCSKENMQQGTVALNAATQTQNLNGGNEPNAHTH